MAHIYTAPDTFTEQDNIRLSKLNGLIEETLTGHHIVRAFSHEEAAMQRFDEDNRKLFRAATISQLASGTSYPLNGIVTDLAYIAICGICGFSVLNGTMPLGDVQAMIQYSEGVSGLVKSIPFAKTLAPYVPQPVKKVIVKGLKEAAKAKRRIGSLLKR